MKGLREPTESKIARQDGNHPGTSVEKQPSGIIPADIFSRVALICSAITAIQGFLAMIGWATGMGSLASLGSGSIPQASGAALAFILLGGTWFFYLRAP